MHGEREMGREREEISERVHDPTQQGDINKEKKLHASSVCLCVCVSIYVPAGWSSRI